MTGYGEARYQSDALNLSMELRSVNNRYLKVSLRATDPYHLLEPEFEKVIRRTVRRGTLQVHLRLERQTRLEDYRINVIALRSYLEQLNMALPPQAFGALLSLPGVVPEPGQSTAHLHDDWPLLEKV